MGLVCWKSFILFALRFIENFENSLVTFSFTYVHFATPFQQVLVLLTCLFVHMWVYGQLVYISQCPAGKCVGKEIYAFLTLSSSRKWVHWNSNWAVKFYMSCSYRTVMVIASIIRGPRGYMTLRSSALISILEGREAVGNKFHNKYMSMKTFSVLFVVSWFFHRVERMLS